MKSNIKRFLATNIICSMLLTSLVSCYGNNEPLSYEEAYSRLYDYKVKFDELLPVEGEIPINTVYDLPSIDQYNYTIEGKGDIDVEIFLHADESTSGIVDIVSYVATLFNEDQMRIDGNIATVSIRVLESNLAEEYILNGINPKGYIAPNELYGYYLQEQGVNISLVNEKTVENTIGIVIDKDEYRELKKEYSEVTIDTIIDASKNERINLAYNNPLNNSVGLNFISSMFSKFNISDLTNVDAVSEFSDFHKSVSLVAFNDEQLQNAILYSNVNAFIADYQSYATNENLKDYKFIPFGIRADNPLYTIGELTYAEEKILTRFSYYFSTTSVRNYAEAKGFNQNEEYQMTWNDTKKISNILNIWKKQRADAEDIRIAFLTDISLSMKNDGKLENLQKALFHSMRYIEENSKVGLFSFNTYGITDLNISEFNIGHQKCFAEAIKNWKSNGETAINNALLVAHQRLLRKAYLDSECSIILITDGGTVSNPANDYNFNQIKDVIDSLDVPIYVIGYGGIKNEDNLKRIADLNNGVYLKADTDNIGYIIKTLFNAES